MNRKGIVSEEDRALLAAARTKRDAAAAAKAQADAEFRELVLDVTDRTGSVRETAKAAGINPDTITQWKKQPN